MRLVTFVALTTLGLGCASTHDATMTSGRLDGTWVPIRQELGGASLPKAAFEKQKLIITDSAYTVFAESVDKGVVTYRDGQMDIYGKDGVNAGKHFTAIYAYEDELLTVCYNLSGDGYPKGFDTKGNRSLFLSVFKRDGMK